jgi:hypothetical protein
VIFLVRKPRKGPRVRSRPAGTAVIFVARQGLEEIQVRSTLIAKPLLGPGSG